MNVQTRAKQMNVCDTRFLPISIFSDSQVVLKAPLAGQLGTIFTNSKQGVRIMFFGYLKKVR